MDGGGGGGLASNQVAASHLSEFANYAAVQTNAIFGAREILGARLNKFP